MGQFFLENLNAVRVVDLQLSKRFAVQRALLGTICDQMPRKGVFS